MQKRPKILITVVDRLGKKGCHRGMRIGKSFDWDTQRGELCPMVAHIAFPFIDILSYGGDFSRKDPTHPYEVKFCCSDPESIIVYKVELVKEPIEFIEK